MQIKTIVVSLQHQTKTKIMKTLRNELYNQIEKLEKELQKFDTNQYGFSSNPESRKICDKIDELETKISETWSK